MKFFIFFALVLATVSAKHLYSRSIEVLVSENEGRIINGATAAPGQFKYQVGLSLQIGEYWSWCGGSLIGKNWVLTAAHCTDGASSAAVYLGATNISIPEKVHNVSKSCFIMHSDYDPKTLINDISLIKIPTTSESKYIGIVRIPGNNDNKYVGDSVITSGWGDISNNFDVPEDLQYAKMIVSPGSVCSDAYGPNITDAMFICASTANKVSPCRGDSGGPLVLEGDNLQIGLVSIGPTAGCDLGYPVGFTRISAYLPWIESNSAIAY